MSLRALGRAEGIFSPVYGMYARRMAGPQSRRAVPFHITSSFANPTSVSGCTMWCRSDLGITLNGATVSAWADQTANNNNYSQATSTLQPRYFASGGPNNQPYINFTGSTKELVNSMVAAPVSIWLVMVSVYNGSSPVAQWSVLGLDGSSFGGATTIILDTDGTATDTNSSTNILQLDDGGAPPKKTLTQGSACALTIHTGSTGGSADLYLNGGTASSDGGPLSTTTGPSLGDVTHAGTCQPMQVCEIATYNRRISAADISNLQSYAHTRYSI